jgi:hypothetical protein
LPGVGPLPKSHQGAQGKIVEKPREDAAQEPEQSEAGIREAETGGPAVSRLDQSLTEILQTESYFLALKEQIENTLT